MRSTGGQEPSPEYAGIYGEGGTQTDADGNPVNVAGIRADVNPETDYVVTGNQEENRGDAVRSTSESDGGEDSEDDGDDRIVTGF
jgi:hypothetical protein